MNTDDIQLDLRTLGYGPIAKYFNEELLEKDIAWYRESGYQVYTLDASQWYTINDFYSAAHEVFEFPGYFGRNWGAFDDCIIDIHRGNTGNVLIVVKHFEYWYKEDRGNAHIFLDIMADQTYSYLVSGKRFITILQSEDPILNVDNVGAKSVNWNWFERDNKSRGIKS